MGGWSGFGWLSHCWLLPGWLLPGLTVTWLVVPAQVPCLWSPHWGPVGVPTAEQEEEEARAVLEQLNHGPWPQESRALQPPPPANKSGSLQYDLIV